MGPILSHKGMKLKRFFILQIECPFPSELFNNGICDYVMNNEVCDYDGDDCCENAHNLYTWHHWTKVQSVIDSNCGEFMYHIPHLRMKSLAKPSVANSSYLA